MVSDFGCGVQPAVPQGSVCSVKFAGRKVDLWVTFGAAGAGEGALSRLLQPRHRKLLGRNVEHFRAGLESRLIDFCITQL